MENASDPCLVLTTWPIDHDVVPVARALVDERLAACVAVGPAVTSYYRWDGQTQHADEQQLVIKTTRSRVAAIETRLGALHPYEVPELLVVAAEASAAYGAWIRESVTAE